MKKTPPLEALDRILVAMEKELIDASDEEVLDAAGELGLNPKMKGSAAFFGLKYVFRPSLAEFFGTGPPGRQTLGHDTGALEEPKPEADGDPRPDDD